MRGGFCCGVHAVLRDFVDSAQWRLLMKPEKLVQRTGAFADRVGFFDRFRHVSLRQNHAPRATAAGRELRHNRRRKRAARAVRVRASHVVAAERLHFVALAQHVNRLVQWPPVTTTARAPISTSFCPAAFIPARSFTSMPVRNSASAIFGVITLARFNNSSRTNFSPRIEQFHIARRGA